MSARLLATTRLVRFYSGGGSRSRGRGLGVNNTKSDQSAWCLILANLIIIGGLCGWEE